MCLTPQTPGAWGIDEFIDFSPAHGTATFPYIDYTPHANDTTLEKPYVLTVPYLKASA